MKVHTMTRSLRIDRPLDEVFAFFAKPENLALITPSSLNFHILTPEPIDMAVGTLIDYTIKIMGMRVFWRTLITRFDPPYEFVDEQLEGPYKMWHHRHSFRTIDSGTLIEDNVTYALPFSFIGDIVHGIYVRRNLDRIFDFRATAISEIFETQASEGQMGR